MKEKINYLAELFGRFDFIEVIKRGRGLIHREYDDCGDEGVFVMFDITGTWWEKYEALRDYVLAETVGSVFDFGAIVEFSDRYFVKPGERKSRNNLVFTIYPAYPGQQTKLEQREAVEDVIEGVIKILEEYLGEHSGPSEAKA